MVLASDGKLYGHNIGPMDATQEYSLQQLNKQDGFEMIACSPSHFLAVRKVYDEPIGAWTREQVQQWLVDEVGLESKNSMLAVY